MFDNYTLMVLKGAQLDKAESLLSRLGLVLEEDVEYTVGLFNGDELIGTGSLSGNILKCIGVDPKFQEGGLTTKIVNELISYQNQRGIHHLFLFTTPTNAALFEGLGFREVERSERLFVLLEIGPHGLKGYLEEMRKHKRAGNNGAVVVNCNPFTLGHQYLIEKAAAEVDNLYVFVVREDRSLFPYKARYELIEKGVSHIKNAYVLSGGEYIISNSTFPSYFLRNEDNVEIVKQQTILDIRIFARHIAPKLGINVRFVGTEPYCETTSSYNNTMKAVLPEFGIELVEIVRKGIGEDCISASAVRDEIRNGRWDRIENLVPKTTYDFLRSPGAMEIIESIKRSDSRH
ncbi:[citrate (pro-3S)-lyase] ligase [bacterium]|nr:[citrate (pro-3S)-lyase] ligase [bacterium]